MKGSSCIHTKHTGYITCGFRDVFTLFPTHCLRQIMILLGRGLFGSGKHAVY